MNARVFLSITGGGVDRAERGEDGTWRVETVLVGEDVRCLAVDPAGSDLVFAGTQGNGLFRSADRGVTWESAGMTGAVVKAAAVAPGGERVYAGTKPPLVFRSDDGGDSWAELRAFRDIPWRRLWMSPAEPPFYTAYVQGLAMSPTDPNVVVVGIEYGAVVRSTDGGETWSRHCEGALRDCHSLAFHATDGDRAYMGGAGLRRRVGGFSRDGGATWETPTDGLDRGYGWAVAADPGDPDVWYVSASTGPSKAHGGGDARGVVFRRTGDGTWVQLDGKFPNPANWMPYALVTDPGDPGGLYVGLANGHVWYSPDRGDSWDQFPFALGGVERSMVVLFER